MLNEVRVINIEDPMAFFINIEYKQLNSIKRHIILANEELDIYFSRLHIIQIIKVMKNILILNNCFIFIILKKV